jgi:hypothetical protein
MWHLTALGLTLVLALWLLAQIVARRRLRYSTRKVEDLPARLEQGILYIVTEGEIRMYAAMACPRRQCTETLNINLLQDDHPVWRLIEHEDGSVSLHPSVWRRNECGCHFFLRSGKVNWS